MKAFINRLRWVHGTRVIGVALIAWAVLNPHDSDRGTFFLGGVGLLGTGFVADREPKA